MVANEAEGRAEALRRIAACRSAQAEELDLGGLQLTALDGELLTALCGLLNLTSLNLWNNNIGDAGAQALAGLVNLTSLDLWNNNIGDAGAQALAGLVNLTSLDLSDNRIGAAGAQALAGLVNLTSLDLWNNDIEDISPLVSLRHLRKINLSRCRLNQVVPAFWMLPSLQEARGHRPRRKHGGCAGRNPVEERLQRQLPAPAASTIC